MRNDLNYSPAMITANDHVDAWMQFMRHALEQGGATKSPPVPMPAATGCLWTAPTPTSATPKAGLSALWSERA